MLIVSAVKGVLIQISQSWTPVVYDLIARDENKQSADACQALPISSDTMYIVEDHTPLEGFMTRSSEAQAQGHKLSKFLCFAIYSANLAFGRAYKPILDAVGLTYTQYIAMVALSEQGDQTVGALGEKLFLQSNTLTPILKKLEQTGYVSRIRDPADERQVRVSLTAAGRRLLKSDLGAALVEACGLGDDFSVVQKHVVRLRDNLLRNTSGKQDET